LQGLRPGAVSVPVQAGQNHPCFCSLGGISWLGSSPWFLAVKYGTTHHLVNPIIRAITPLPLTHDRSDRFSPEYR